MPAFQSRDQQNQLEELSEVPYTGPWGGVQSEMPLDRIEPYGLYDIVNMICRKGALTVRPGLTLVPQFPHVGPTLGIFDFFDAIGTRHQTALSNTRLFEWIGGSQTWLEIAGTLFTGSPSQLWSAVAVNYLMAFSQGVDKVQLYNPVAGTYAVASADAPAARFLMELNQYLIAGNLVEGGTSFPQRIRWTGPGDPTDWISLDAGIQDLVNNLGPINGLVNIFQTGFAFQQRGITQIVPTGNGLKPFQFVPIASNGRGLPFPYSLAVDGSEIACYAGNNNIYSFDGTQSTGIGDMPIDGRKRLGARRRIYADLSVANPQTVNACITETILGNDFNAYWLNIPGVSTWCYAFDEQNWFRFTWDDIILCMNRFAKQAIIRIMDLVGPISAQNWTPATLAASNPLDSMLLGFPETQGTVEFSTVSEKNWSATSGQLTFGDLRHNHNIKKVRVTIQDNGQVQFTLTLTGIQYPNPNAALDNIGQPISTNDNQQSQSQTVFMGNGTGQAVSRVLDFDLPGNYIIWKISGASGQPLSLVEVCPVFDVGGEQRGG